MNKKADEFMNWPEICCFLALLLGFFFALQTPNVILKYFVLLLVALAFGRMCYLYIKFQQVHLYLIIIGFLIGFILGAQANLLFVLIIFVLGMVVSYYAHKENWIPLLK